MAVVRRVPLSGLSNFPDLLSKFTEINGLYHHYGRCDYIFGICNGNPSVKDTERLRLRRCSKPVVLSSVKLSTPIPNDMKTFWSSSQNEVLLEITNLCFLAWKVFGKAWRANACNGLSPSRSQNLCCYIQRYWCNSCPAVLYAYLSSRGSSGTVGKGRKRQHYPFCPSANFVHTIGSPYVYTVS